MSSFFADAKPPKSEARPLIPVEDPAFWYRHDLPEGDKWIRILEPQEIAEIERAVEHVQRSGIELRNVTRAKFEMPTFGPVLDGLRDEIINGRGFAVIRGLPVERYTQEQTATAFWGIGQYFGELVSQNAKGHLLGHVKDLGYTRENPSHRGYQTSEELLYHSDSCDMSVLLCLNPAKSGGVSRIMSSVTLHNEMLKRKPEWVEGLSAALYRDRRNEVPVGLDPWYVLPVFNYHAGFLTTSLASGNLRMAQRHEEVPRLTPAQAEALDVIDKIGAEDDTHLEFDLQRGDMEFLHNHVVMHSRTRYENFPEPERHRHLLRLWLSTPGGRPLPSGYAERYGGVKEGARPGGIITKNTVLNVTLEPLGTQ